MIERNNLIELLNHYNINGKKIISKNASILDYGKYNQIKEVVEFLVAQYDISQIENAPLGKMMKDLIEEMDFWF